MESEEINSNLYLKMLFSDNSFAWMGDEFKISSIGLWEGLGHSAVPRTYSERTHTVYEFWFLKFVNL